MQALSGSRDRDLFRSATFPSGRSSAALCQTGGQDRQSMSIQLAIPWTRHFLYILYPFSVMTVKIPDEDRRVVILGWGQQMAMFAWAAYTYLQQ